MKHSAAVYLGIGLVIMALAGTALADTLELKDGALVEGKYVGGTQNTVRFQVGNEVKSYSVADVLALTFTGSGRPPAAAAPSASPPAPSPAPQPTSAVNTVPAGSRLRVRMRDTLDSRRSGPGTKFAATLDADLSAGAAVVAPRGSTVYGRLVSAKKSGRLVGQSELKVELTDISINGKPHPLVTGEVKAISERTGRKTARRTGFAAGIGALIDGSDGAKTGAAIGLAASVLTGGNQVNIPAGSLLEFRLAAPFTPL